MFCCYSLCCYCSIEGLIKAEENEISQLVRRPKEIQGDLSIVIRVDSEILDL